MAIHRAPALRSRRTRSMTARPSPGWPSAGAAAAGGCAALQQPRPARCRATGDWPAERKPGSFAFERLPSQQAQAEDTAALEARRGGRCSRPASRRRRRRQRARRAGAGRRARSACIERRRSGTTRCGGVAACTASWRYGPWLGPVLGLVGLGIRPATTRSGAADPRRAAASRCTRARASDGIRPRRVRWRMFDAALKDFPRRVSPRRVTIDLPP